MVTSTSAHSMHRSATVYRNIDAETSLLGLAFPLEFLLVLSAYWLFLAVLPFGLGLLCGAVTYVGVRLLGSRRGPHFVQHWGVFQVRRALTSGHLSAAARAAAPRFPFAPYDCRGDCRDRCKRPPEPHA